MTRRMLIDATHSEETRVAVVDGNKLVDFDYESQLRKQLKGSIFLAKVTRVEPSLQAAFVNFGGNRHGFLPFSEIHPDYFRIPIADREALIAAQQAEIEEMRAREEAEDAEEADAGDEGDTSERAESTAEEESDEEEIIEEIGGEDQVAPPEGELDEAAADGGNDLSDENGDNGDEDDSDGEESRGNEADEAEENTGEAAGLSGEDDAQPAPGNERESEPEDVDGNRVSRPHGRQREDRGHFRGRGRRGRGGRIQARSKRFEKYGDDDSGPRTPGRRNYKIQEVVKRGQIMLVQVSREERGNKGAAVTTYLSLPGRYCVLMPNSQRAGGVSRKVASFQERRRMREMLAELTVPQGMSVIMRTAGVSRTKPEIKRDLDYLLKLWDTIRELTLQSTAPALVHEEGQLIRRAIRDIYGRDIDEIEVAGEEGYKLAREYMKMMIPSHVKRVNFYNDEKTPLFHRYQVENQISGMGEPSVTLRSGGYLVINPTEALVSIDVNSGRATRERHIEETALKTNLEAAEEVARQLRLRDLGGLIVIDFIDMEDRRNNRKVENRLRDALSSDRARIQMGRISSFGLLEMSRQRLNPSLTEAQFEKCEHCKGIGHVRTVDMTAIMALRALEEEGIKNRAAEVALNVPDRVALYILNNKRSILADIERRYGFHILIRNDESLAPSGFRVEPLRTAEGLPVPITPEEKNGEVPLQSSGEREHRHHHHRDGEGEGDGRGGRRRRGRRGGRNRNRNHFDGDRDDNMQNREEGHSVDPADMPQPPEEGGDGEITESGESGGNESFSSGDQGGGEHRPGEGRRRGRRRGRRGRGGRGRHNRDSRDNYSGGQRGDHSGHETADNNGNYAGSESGSYSSAPESVKTHSAPVAPPQDSAPPSNDAAPPAPRDYERVNEPPANKKKGWWNRLTE